MFHFELGQIYLDRYGRKHVISCVLIPNGSEWEYHEDIYQAGFRASSVCSDGSQYYLKPDGFCQIHALGDYCGQDHTFDQDARSVIVSQTSAPYEDQIEVYQNFGMSRDDAIESLVEIDNEAGETDR